MDEQKKEITVPTEETPKVVPAKPPKPYYEVLRGMSHNQLCGELRRKAKNSQSILGAIEAITLLTVLENTKSRGNPFAKLEAYPR